MNIIISNETRGSIASQLGAAHYSYRFAEAKFRTVLEQEAPVWTVKYPYAYPDPGLLREELNLPEGDLVHIAFRSAENLRPIKGLYNICAFAWEFDILNDTDWRGQTPIFNQHRMLGLFDEIWATSHYTRDILVSHGLEHVHTIPAPVTDSWEDPELYTDADLEGIELYPLKVNLGVRDLLYAPGVLWEQPAGLPDKLREARDAGLLFTTILNPHDQRKNMRNMVGAFEAFAQTTPEACMIIKVSIPNRMAERTQLLLDGLRRGLGSISSIDSDNIFLAVGYLSDHEISALHALSDFYLSPSISEGQNLPLIEGMMARSIPVSTANTAMLDYIDDDNAITIATKTLPGSMLDLASTNARKPFTVEMASAYDIYCALQAAARLTPEQRQFKSAAARDAVLALYAPDVVREKVRDRISNISKG